MKTDRPANEEKNSANEEKNSLFCYLIKMRKQVQSQILANMFDNTMQEGNVRSFRTGSKKCILFQKCKFFLASPLYFNTLCPKYLFETNFST